MMSEKHKNFNFWQDHSLEYLDMAMRADKRERVEHPDGYGSRTGECGDTIEMFIQVKKDRIESVSFEADGCMNTVACANTVIHLAENRSADACWDLSTDDITGYLKTLPVDEIHCAELALGALYLAMTDYKTKHNKA